MKKMVLVLIMFAVFGCNEVNRRADVSGSGQYINSDNRNILAPDAYGLGVHKNRFGQAVRVSPDFGGVDNEQLNIKTDAYGFGVHSDQYCRPVREHPWP